MLDVSRRLNPDCEHLVGDMRTLRLGRTFDAMLVHDAIDYMLTEADLARAIETAWMHCRPGGVAVFVPDHVRQTFRPATDHGGTDGADGRGARYLQWSWDPDPTDTTVRTDYAFVLRDPDDETRVVLETHLTGLFDRKDWLRLIAEAGFEATSTREIATGDWVPRELFVGHRPK